MSDIIAVSGAKNSGKTTLIERLIKYYDKIGIKTAAIKHDGHNFAPDRENSDSRKLKIFFTRNKLADRSILLTTRRPSSTTEGIHEKLDSSNTS